MPLLVNADLNAEKVRTHGSVGVLGVVVFDVAPLDFLLSLAITSLLTNKEA